MARLATKEEEEVSISPEKMNRRWASPLTNTLLVKAIIKRDGVAEDVSNSISKGRRCSLLLAGGLLFSSSSLGQKTSSFW